MNNNDKKVVKFIAKAVVVTTFSILLPAGALVAAGAGIWAGSKIAAKCASNEEAREAAEFTADIGEDFVRSGTLSAMIDGGKRAIELGAAKELAKNNLSTTTKKIGLIRTAYEGASETYDWYGDFGKPSIKLVQHRSHLNKEIDYDSDCEVCQE